MLGNIRIVPIGTARSVATNAELAVLYISDALLTAPLGSITTPAVVSVVGIMKSDTVMENHVLMMNSTCITVIVPWLWLLILVFWFAVTSVTAL